MSTHTNTGTEALVYSLLHSLWQAGGIVLLLSILLRLIPARRAQARYLMSLLAMIGVLLAGAFTWACLDASPRGALSQKLKAVVPATSPTKESGEVNPQETHDTVHQQAATAPSQSAQAKPAWNLWLAGNWVSWVAVLWASGAMVFLVRSAWAVVGAERICRQATKLGEARIVAMAERIRTAMGICRPIRVLVSEQIKMPAVVGLIRPAILIPAGLLTGAPGQYLEAVLAHEFAHIRRWDYWVNIAQMLLESLLFFNPFVWWISRQIRKEREACCDQIAAEHCETRAVYLEALLACANSANLSLPAAALAASGAERTLVDRAKRLLQPAYRPVLHLQWRTLALILVACGFSLFSMGAGARAAAKVLSGEEQLQKRLDGITEAARAGNAAQIKKLIEESFDSTPSIGEDGGKRMLDSLANGRELKPFSLLLKELRKTNLGKDWQPDDALLASLVKAGRTDFLDVLLSERLDLKRLEAQQKLADGKTKRWIDRRLAETQRERGDIKKLVDACAKGDVAAVRGLLDAGAEINGRMSDDSSWTPLTRAASEGRVEVVKLLLERGAKPDLPKFPGWDYTPLCLAKNREVADLLLAGGANLNAKLFGRDVHILSYCVTFGTKEMVQWYFDHGVDPTKVKGDEPTLLFEAGRPETAEMLIAHGVDVNATDGTGQTALFFIEQMKKKPAKTVEVLLKHGADANHRDHFGNTPLMSAPDGETVDVLVRAGADLNAVNQDGHTALTCYVPNADASRTEALRRHGLNPDSHEQASLLINALQAGRPNDVKILLKQGIDPKTTQLYKGKVCATPLSSAISDGYFEIADLLRQSGAGDVGPLSQAAAMGDLKQMQALLDSGANIEERCARGETPLLCAVRRGQVEAVRFLLEHGANVNAFDYWGNTAYHQARAVVNGVTLQNFSRIRGMKTAEAKKASEAILALLREHKQDFNYCDPNGDSALSKAAAIGNSMAAGEILKPGLSLNTRNKDGMTPLMLAVQGQPKNPPMIVSVSTTGNESYAKKYSERGFLVKELLMAGADSSLKNKEGKTALDLAQATGNQEIIAILKAGK